MEFSKVSLKIAVENQDQGEVGEGLVSYLKEHNQIKEVPKDREALKDAMYYQEIDYVLLIPKDFTERFAAGEGEELLEGTAVPGSSTWLKMKYSNIWTRQVCISGQEWNQQERWNCLQKTCGRKQKLTFWKKVTASLCRSVSISFNMCRTYFWWL